MPDLFDELDRWAEEHEDETSDPAPVPTPAEQGVGGFSLEALAAGTSKWSELAKDLLEMRADREARAEAEGAAADAAVALEAGNADFDDPAVQQQLLALVLARRAEATAIFEKHMRASLKGQGLSPEAIDAQMVQEREANRVAVTALGDPSLFELGEYRTHVAAKTEQAKAEQVAIDMQVRQPGSLEIERQAAEDGVAAAVQKVLSR